MRVTELTPEDFPELLLLWEASVRATHDFLCAEDIEMLRVVVRDQAFPNLILRGIRDEGGRILAFLGVSGNFVEALFVAPDAFGKGAGSLLMRYAETELGTTKVDVNEQNPKALGFYQRIGYEITGRSALDGQGRAFPILHLEKIS